MLGDRRGSILEAIVGRLQVLKTSPAMECMALASLRLGAVSATVPNADDVATWLRVPQGGLRVYGKEMRPVPLETRVIGYREDKRGPFMFERTLG